METELILSILSIIGIGGIIATFFTYFWQRKAEINSKEMTLKQERYRCILILMYTFINPKEMNNLKRIRPEIRNLDDLKRELQTELVSSWIYAGDYTIQSLKEFIDNPSEKTLSKTILSMRKELWNKGTNLPVSAFSTKNFL